MVVLEWLDQPYRLSRVDREVRGTELYKRFNPLGQVPALRIDGKILTENAAILTHLAEQRPELALLPRDRTWERDQANQWLSFLSSNFHPAFYPYFAPQRYLQDSSMYKAIKDAAIQNVREKLRFVDQRLGKQFFIGQRSVIDPYFYAMSRWTKTMADLPKEYPAVAAHQALLEQDPAIQQALALERGENSDLLVDLKSL